MGGKFVSLCRDGQLHDMRQAHIDQAGNKWFKCENCPATSAYRDGLKTY